MPLSPRLFHTSIGMFSSSIALSLLILFNASFTSCY
jgi:hypothetical protein